MQGSCHYRFSIVSPLGIRAIKTCKFLRFLGGDTSWINANSLESVEANALYGARSRAKYALLDETVCNLLRQDQDPI
jgi:hypothetical protein